MSDKPNISKYMKAFTAHICPVCGLCDSKFPSFCMTMYGGDADRFLDILRCINALRATNRPVTISDIYTFEGFCGLFCNSKDQCPIKSGKCDGLVNVLHCYDSFANQCGVSSVSTVGRSIWEEFSGVDTKTIGTKYNVVFRSSLQAISKKKRKKINKIIKKARSNMRRDLHVAKFINSINKATKVKKRPPTKTTFFTNDNKEWERMVDSYLNSETNNRQSTTAT